MAMRFRVLGPLEVEADDGAVAVAGAAATLLAALIASPARLVSLGDLIGALWGTNPPTGPEKAIQSYVSRLRRALGPHADIVVTRKPGYLLDVDPGQIDAVTFERLVGSGLRAAGVGAHVAAARRLRQAETLWRSDAYAEFGDAPFAARERARLGELRTDAREAAIAAELSGGGGGLIDELEELVADHPLRERLWSQLVTALYRAGRQADALAAYQRARTTLIDEVGVEPGAELRAAERAVLAQDPGLARPLEASLPPELAALAGAAFIGRDAELAELVAALDDAAFGRAGLRVVRGQAESGKTRLLAELAAIAARRGAVVRYAGAGAGVAALFGAEARYGLHLLDDADQADPDDLRRLGQHWAGTLGQARLVVVTTTNGKSGIDNVAADAVELVLAPLPDDAVRSLVRLYLDPDAAEPDEVARLAARTGGMPGRAHRMAAEWAESTAAAQIGTAVEAMVSPRRATAAAREQIVAGVLQLELARAGRAAQRADPAATATLCPYKGLSRYDTADAPFFFGRARVSAEMVAALVGRAPLVVTGPSGSGKSSAVRAGLLPAVAAGALPGSAQWRQVVTTPSRGQMPELLAELGPDAILVLDQFEEVFTALTPADRDAYLELIARASERGTAVVITLRSDYLGRAAESPPLAALIAENAVFVGALGARELHEAITGPAQTVGLELEPGLLDDLLADMGDEAGHLPLLSTAMLALWEAREGRRLTRVAYAREAGIAHAVESLGERAYAQLPSAQQAAARRILQRLADVDDEGQYVRRMATRADLVAVGGQDADGALTTMVDNRLLTVDGGRVEVTHEALLRQWPRLRGWLDDDAAGRQLRRHLVPTARDWVGQGRDPAELYRGARLAGALEWGDAHRTELTGAEAEFLDASREAVAADAARARRTTNRLKILAGAAAIALVATLIAAVTAIGERGSADTARDRADRASLTADARRLSAQSLTERNLRLAMLEAVAATRLDSSAATAYGVLDTLARAPMLVAAGGDEDADRQLSLALSPDGSTVAIGSREGVVRVYAAATLRKIAQWRDPNVEPVYGLAFDGDGSVASWDDGELAVHDVLTGRTVMAPTPKPPASEGAVVPGTHVLILADPDTETIRFDLRGGAQSIIAPAGRYQRVTAAGPGQGVVLAGAGGVARVGATGAPTTLLAQATWVAAISPDGRTLALDPTYGSPTVQLWDVSRHALVSASQRHTTGVMNLAWAGNGGIFASSSDDQILVWSGSTVQTTLDVPAGGVQRIAVSADGRRVLATGLDGELYEWDLAESEMAATVVRRPGPFPTEPGCTDEATTGFTPVATGFLVACSHVTVLDAATGLPRTPLFSIPSQTMTAFTPDRSGRRVAIAYQDGSVEVWDTRSATSIAKLVLPAAQPPAALALSDDDRVLAAVTAGDEESTVAVVDAQTGRAVEPRRRVPARVMAVAVDPAGHTVAVGRADGRVSAWRVGSSQPPTDIVLAPDAYRIHTLGFSPDGRYIGAGGGSGRPSLVAADSLRLLWRAAIGHAGISVSIAFSPDGQTMISGGSDGQQLVYDLGTGDLLATLNHEDPQWNFVTFLADGKHLAFAEYDGSIRVQALDPQAWIERACAIANRDLSPAEWARLLPGRAAQPVCPPRTGT